MGNYRGQEGKSVEKMSVTLARKDQDFVVRVQTTEAFLAPRTGIEVSCTIPNPPIILVEVKEII